VESDVRREKLLDDLAVVFLGICSLRDHVISKTAALFYQNCFKPLCIKNLIKKLSIQTTQNTTEIHMS